MTQQGIFCSLVFALSYGKSMAEKLINEWGQESSLDETNSEALNKKKKERNDSFLLKKNSWRGDMERSQKRHSGSAATVNIIRPAPHGKAGKKINGGFI